MRSIVRGKGSPRAGSPPPRSAAGGTRAQPQRASASSARTSRCPVATATSPPLRRGLAERGCAYAAYGSARSGPLNPAPGYAGETPVDLFRRVALNLASAEAVFDASADVEAWAERFFRLMTNWEFLPNAPTLLGAGRPLRQLHACFVLPVEDSIESIFSALRMAAIVHSRGGDTGFSFGSLRGRGEPIATGGVSTGAVSFMRLFDETEVTKHGGTGWGANVGVLPDIREFVSAKDGASLRNFNLSVAVDDDWMRAAVSGSDPDASALLDLIASRAWRCGDPGLLFLDRIERDNPVPSLGALEATNPCGEAPLLPFEACCLGGPNVARFVDHSSSEIRWPGCASPPPWRCA